MQFVESFKPYFRLIRLNQPIGFLLLLWPTLWGLWLASEGKPSLKNLLIFIAGTFLMRSAGCVFNDMADHQFDQFVRRTQSRPIAMGQIAIKNAMIFGFILLSLAFFLVLLCNQLTIYLSLVGALLSLSYPWLKRLTHLPQLGLGMAFSWGIIMAFSAEKNQLPGNAFLLFGTAILWPLIYDTCYAMVDREDDLKIGVKSMAILIKDHERLWIACLQFIFLGLLLLCGYQFHLNYFFYSACFVISLLFLYQQFLLKHHIYFKVFLNHQWVGMIIFWGIFLNFI